LVHLSSLADSKAHSPKETVMDWWTPEQAGVIGAVSGVAIGVGFGGVSGGMLAGLAKRGQARRGSRVYLRCVGALGLLLLLGAGAALIVGQPWYVWLSLLLPATLILALVPVVTYELARRYQAALALPDAAEIDNEAIRSNVGP